MRRRELEQPSWAVRVTEQQTGGAGCHVSWRKHRGMRLKEVALSCWCSCVWGPFVRAARPAPSDTQLLAYAPWPYLKANFTFKTFAYDSVF